RDVHKLTMAAAGKSQTRHNRPRVLAGTSPGTGINQRCYVHGPCAALAQIHGDDNERPFRTSWRLSNPSRKGLISGAGWPLATLPMAAWWGGMWATTPCFWRAVAMNYSRSARRAPITAARSPKD